jgi:glycosyltransferase involved in cell wall biosynthesis
MIAHEQAQFGSTMTAVGRNDPCPCGSGRRYKDCCGALSLTAGVSSAPPSSEIQTQLAAALRHQLDAEFDDAQVLYRKVLATSDANVDALNMLAMVEFNLGNLDASLALADDAIRLAPTSSEVRQNHAFVRAAAELRAFRDAIFDPAVDSYPASDAQPPLIHIYQVAGNPAGGTEWHCVELARRLRQYARVVVWTNIPQLSIVLRSECDIRVVDPDRGEFPNEGTLLVAGSFHHVGDWYTNARFRRVVLLYNVVLPAFALRSLRQLCLPGKPQVELLYASNWMKMTTGLPGLFEPSPIDTDRFSPKADPTTRPWESLRSPDTGRRTSSGAPSSFVVGRLSRDEGMKFHLDAAAFYRALAADGITVRLMGATAMLGPALSACDGIELLSENAVAANEFLQGLDCFTYRTHPSLCEAWGRVVPEAMATGLPVVVHANGGYAQIIEHGVNGYLFHRDEEAIEHIRALRASAELREHIGRNARATVLELCSTQAFERHLQFYLR